MAGQSHLFLSMASNYCQYAKATIKKAETDLAHLELLRKSQRVPADTIKSDREALEVAELTFPNSVDTPLSHSRPCFELGRGGIAESRMAALPI
ncbi:MAG: hypothetical protein ABIU05_25740 [Nitrospirales bacterium]